MTDKPTALLARRVANPDCVVTHITAIDKDGQFVTLNVLTFTPERPGPIRKGPDAWQEGFDAALRGLTREKTPTRRATV